MQKTEIPEDKNIKLISMHDEMSSSYLSYAMSVIVSRALPDVRDGLKPVHRRILYAMYKGGYDWSKQFRKSARIVGDVIGKYHPHGDQSVYDALVRMVQDFSMSLPLIQGQGNFGSIDGDPPAAMRYTETRLSKVSQFLINDIEKDLIRGIAGERLRKGLKIALIGAPNVGKSSLINLLLKEDRAIVSASAGTTRDTIEARLNLEEVPVTLYDTAGIRDAKDKIEKEGVLRSKSIAEEADIILNIWDSSADLKEKTIDLSNNKFSRIINLTMMRTIHRF